MIGYSLIIICLVVVWPLWSVYFLLANREKLQDQDGFKKKFTELYQGINTDSFRALCYNAVFSARRFDILLMNAYFTKDSVMSGIDRTYYLQKILAFLFIQTIYLAYVHNVHPHSESIFNKLEFVNEYLMVTLAYIMLNFTKLAKIQDPHNSAEYLPKSEKFSELMEYLAIGLISLILLVNFAVMIKLSLNKLIIYCKKRRVKNQMKKMLLKRL